MRTLDGNKKLPPLWPFPPSACLFTQFPREIQSNAALRLGCCLLNPADALAAVPSRIDIHALERALLKDAPIANLLVEELIDIKTNHLSFLCDTQVHEGNELERVQQNARNDEAVGRDSADLGELAADLDADAVERTLVDGGSVERRDPLLRKDAREERARHATDAVEFEDIHALVDTKPFVDVLASRADGTREEANEGGDPDGHKTRGGRDADKPRDGARTRAHEREAAPAADVVDQHPAQHTEACRRVGVEDGHGGSDRRVERRPTVEAEPPKPDEASADEDEGGVMGLAVNFVAFVNALAEDEGVCEGRPEVGVSRVEESVKWEEKREGDLPSGSDVNRASTSKVQRGKVVQPSVGIPGPACDGAVYDGGPAERKNHGWHNATTLEATTDDKHHGANAEQHLIEAKDDFGEKRGTRRRSSNDILHSEVGHVADERASGSRVRERIAPEHPLEAHPMIGQR